MRTQRLFWIINLLVAAAVAGGLWSPGQRVMAQDTTNLLVNGGLERPYYGQGASTRTAPNGWNLWVGGGAPDAFPHTDRVQVRDGEVSWNLKQGSVAFTTAGWQRVGGLTKGDAVKLTAYGWVYTCNDTTNSCIITDPPYRRSDTSAGASLKVGIDPTGGTDPNSAAVQWSAGTAPYDQWAEMNVTATAQGDAVTVFLYTTQAKGLALNNVYWDQASLVRTTAGPSAEPTVAEVPFVKPQGVRPDGSIIHVVQEGDTLSSIAYAYSVDYSVTIDSIVALNSGLKRNTRYLRLGQEIMILPPGSVDPKTGRLLTPGATTTTPGAATPAATGTRPATSATSIPSPTPLSNPAAANSPTPQATATARASATPVSTAVQNTQPLPSIGSPEQTAKTTEEVAVEPTEIATEQIAADTPTSAPTLKPTLEPTATLEPSATPAPSATAQTVAEAGVGVENGTLCVSIYQDANLNGARDAEEASAAAAEIVIAQRGSAETAYQYDGANGPLCLDLLPGQYQVSARLPAGWGMTTADAAAVSLVGGRQVSVIFGGAEGYVSPAAPQVSGEQPTLKSGAVAPMVTVVVKPDEENKSALDRLYDNSGLIVLAFAGVVVVSSTVLLLVLRRFTR